jgi:outer membrane protein
MNISHYLYADDKIAFIDVDYIINNSITGKNILKEIRELNNNNISKLKKYEDDIKLKEAEINKVKNVISQDQLNKKISLLKKDFEIYKKEQDLMAVNFNKIRDKKFKSLIDEISLIIQNYMTENSISIVFEKKNIFTGRKEYDITNNILNIYNK